MNKLKKNILITFDYELFLGQRSGTVQNCLIKPTNLILEVLNKHKLKGIFFIDTTYIQRLKDISKKSSTALHDYQIIKNQLINIDKQGHYLYHHIHPHWLDAQYLPEINQWNLSNTSRFSLNNLKIEEIDSILKYSNYFLNKISKNSKHYKFGFRAGGLYVQPFDKIEPFFKKYNISYDFSVLKEAKSINELYSFDFSNAPKNPIYRFQKNVLIPDKHGSFTEISLNQIELKNVLKIINGINYRLTKYKFNHKCIGDGNASLNRINNSKKKNSNYLKGNETISIELLNPIRRILYFKYLSKNDFMHFISHPKLMSPHSINQFDFFLKQAASKYNIETNLEKVIENYQCLV